MNKAWSVLLAFVIASVTMAQEEAMATAESEDPVVTLEEATLVLEDLAENAGVQLKPKVFDPALIDLNVDVQGKKPVAPPPPPPGQPPTPPPTTPPFIPTVPSLEIYREALEKFRAGLEKKVDKDHWPKREYDKALEEYKRRIDLYRDVTKIVKERKGDQ